MARFISVLLLAFCLLSSGNMQAGINALFPDREPHAVMQESAGPQDTLTPAENNEPVQQTDSVPDTFQLPVIPF